MERAVEDRIQIGSKGSTGHFCYGAVYDRATFKSEWAKCAVIDRAYSGEDASSLNNLMI